MPIQRQQVPLKIVGGTKFGRYPKISVENTFNMIVSDNALVDYAGYANIAQMTETTKGRGIHASTIGDFMLAVVGSQVYRINSDLVPFFVPGGNLETTQGDVYIAENNNSQIAITDGVRIYVYNYFDNTFKTSGIDFPITYTFTFRPGFITFQNTRFIVAALGTDNWVLSGNNDALSWPADASHIGQLQTKADRVQAAIPFPGRGNLLFLMGNTVTESWTDVGARLFPYQRSSSFNVDYGCINPSTIAWQDNYIVWLGISEESGVVLLYTTGGETKHISTDGIDFQLSQLSNPEDCTGFMVKIDGHLMYHFTFNIDNLSYIYDFNTEQFFTVTDENLNYFIARQIVFFNNDYYFVSFNDGNLYRLGTQYTNYTYSLPNAEVPIVKEIPRIRICPPIRLPSQNYFIANSLSFTIENGQPNPTTTSPDGVVNTNMAIDLLTSRDGGVNFGSSYRYNLNPTAQRRSKLIYYRLGQANDLSVQLQFWGLQRFVAFDGLVECYS